MKHLVILGGGTAGTMAANKLRKTVAASQLAITVVDRDDAHHYQPGYLFLPFGQYTRDDIVRPRHGYIGPGVDIVSAEIDRVDATAHLVHLIGMPPLSYDYLVIATGTSPRPELTPGLTEAGWGETAHEFYTLPGALRLAEAMRHFRGGRLLVHITEMPIKCPVAPLEFTFLADAWLREHGIRERTELVYVTPLDGAFTKPVASRELGTALARRSIELVTDFAVEGVDGRARTIRSYDGRELDYDLLVTVPLNLGAEYLARSGLGDESNYVECDQHTLQARFDPDIFVLGDAGTLPTSKAGSVAHFSVEIFVGNFLELLAGKPLTHSFDGHANCFIESGDGKGMLLDFNYDTEPLTGVFPLPGIGPFALLRETRANHLGKLAFKWVYWNLLLPGRPLPLPTAMSVAGKRPATELPRPAAPGPTPRPRLTAEARSASATPPESLPGPIVPKF